MTAVLRPCFGAKFMLGGPTHNHAIHDATSQYATDKRRRDEQRTSMGVWHDELLLLNRNRGAFLSARSLACFSDWGRP